MTATDKLSERTLRLKARAEQMTKEAESYGISVARDPSIRSMVLDAAAQTARDLAYMSAAIDRLERIA